MKEFAIMVWTSEHAAKSSIFGVVDKADPKRLPAIDGKGHWADFRTVPVHRAPYADDAKASIAKVGYYLMGAQVEITRSTD